jgi:hypothetical protein
MHQASHVEGSAFAQPTSTLRRNAMDLQAAVDGEAPVELLLLRAEEPCRVRHRNDLRLIDFIWLTMGHDARRPASQDVLRAIGACAVREGDEKVIVVLNRHDRGLLGGSR